MISSFDWGWKINYILYRNAKYNIFWGTHCSGFDLSLAIGLARCSSSKSRWFESQSSDLPVDFFFTELEKVPSTKCLKHNCVWVKPNSSLYPRCKLEIDWVSSKIVLSLTGIIAFPVILRTVHHIKDSINKFIHAVYLLLLIPKENWGKMKRVKLAIWAQKCCFLNVMFAFLELSTSHRELCPPRKNSREYEYMYTIWEALSHLYIYRLRGIKTYIFLYNHIASKWNVSHNAL